MSFCPLLNLNTSLHNRFKTSYPDAMINDLHMRFLFVLHRFLRQPKRIKHLNIAVCLFHSEITYLTIMHSLLKTDFSISCIIFSCCRINCASLTSMRWISALMAWISPWPTSESTAFRASLASWVFFSHSMICRLWNKQKISYEMPQFHKRKANGVDSLNFVTIHNLLINMFTHLHDHSSIIILADRFAYQKRIVVTAKHRWRLTVISLRMAAYSSRMHCCFL